jgi:hypothetical protein
MSFKHIQHQFNPNMPKRQPSHPALDPEKNESKLSHSNPPITLPKTVARPKRISPRVAKRQNSIKNRDSERDTERDPVTKTTRPRETKTSTDTIKWMFVLIALGSTLTNHSRPMHSK